MLQNKNISDAALLSDRIYSILRNEIVLCKMPPGDRVNLLQLGKNLNVSGAPIREAINLLAKDGLVTIKQRRQPEVSAIDPADYQVIIQMRQYIEPYAARLSAGKTPFEKLEQSRRLINEALASPDDEYLNLEANLSLHNCIYSGVSCFFLTDTCLRLKLHASRLHQYALLHFPLSAEEKRNRVTRAAMEHLLLLDVVEKGDPDKIDIAVRNHINKYVKEIVEYMDRLPECDR